MDLVKKDILARPPVFGGIDFEQRAKLGLEAVSAIAAGEARLKALTDGKRKPCCLVRFVEFAERHERAETVVGACPIARKTGARSEERRVGKECGSTGRSWWAPYH